MTGRPLGSGLDLAAQLHFEKMRSQFAGVESQKRIGPWQIEGRLGGGSMGTVFLARNLKLQRLVALKMLSPARADDPTVSTVRMVREAQALAQIRHPHVLQIHDVDTSGPRPIIEMEHIDGSTLGEWVKRDTPPWREIVEAYADAGEGLAAIHAVGLVHRDVKPDNLLRDNRGVVKVADLGLAIASLDASAATHDPLSASVADEPLGSRGEQASDPRDSILGTRVTRASTLVGTLDYAAPEVLALGEATPASDQFGFAVSLYQALHGKLPFEGRTPGDLADAMRTGTLGSPVRRLPGWLSNALQRGLSFAPEDRHISMTVFVDGLRRGLRRRRRWQWLLGLFGASTSLVVSAWALKPDRLDPCAEVGAELQEIWSPQVREELREGLPDDGSGGHAERAQDVLERTLDEFATRWAETRARSCAVTQLHGMGEPGTVGRELGARQQACLEYGHRTVGTLIHGLLADPAPPPGQRISMAAAVEQLPACDDPRQLTYWDTGPRYPESIGPLTEALARVVTLEATGRFDKAESEVRSLLRRMAAEQPFLHAEALYRLGHVLGSQERRLEAYEALDQARNAAFAIGHDALVCQAVIYQAKVAANLQLDPETSRRELGLVDACMIRTGVRSPLLEADRHEARGLWALAAGEVDEGVDQHRVALKLRREHLGDDDPETSKSLHNLGNALRAAGETDNARARLQEALEAHRRQLGPAHPRVADALADLGDLLRELGEFDAAREHLRHAAAILEEQRGSDAPALARVHLQRALVELDDGALGATQQQLEHVQDIVARHPESALAAPDRAALLQARGVLDIRRGHPQRALGKFQRATAWLLRHDPHGATVQDGILKELGMYYDLQQYADLVERHREGGAPLESHIDELPARERGMMSWYVGEAYRQQGQRAEAAAQLERALAGFESAQESAASTDPDSVQLATYMADLRWTLAPLTVEEKPAAARARAEAALVHFQDHDPVTAAAIKRWLAEGEPSPQTESK